jgi:hypothetical protein
MVVSLVTFLSVDGLFEVFLFVFILFLVYLVVVILLFLLSLSSTLLLLFSLFWDYTEVDDYFHLISFLCLSLGLLLGNLQQGLICHLEYICNFLLMFIELSHKVGDFLFKLLIAVRLGHSTSLQFLLNFLEPFLNLLLSLSFLPITSLLLLLINRNKCSDGFSRQLVP